MFLLMLKLSINEVESCGFLTSTNHGSSKVDLVDLTIDEKG